MESADLRTDAGLTTITFNVDAGRIKVFLPDDVRSGDTISGTVVAEPAGGDEAERTKNAGLLNKITVYLSDQKMFTPDNGPKFTWLPKLSNPTAPSRYIVRISDISPSRAGPAVYASMYTAGTPPPPAFHLPVLGQNGRAVIITGPFDGNSDNTKCSVGGTACWVVAESPRKALVQIPADSVGPTTLSIGEDKLTSGPFRNIGINLSVPKTSLLKDEKTTVDVQIMGLAGITNAVTVQLVTTGAVSMEGGNTQTVQISSGQVGPGGKASFTKTITGVQPGPFNVTTNILQ
jgi:hypothetical protein